MIQVSGYFYDATTQQKIGERGNYTIACMAGYNYNITEALVQMQFLEEFADIQHWAATQYLLDSQPGSVGLNYSANLPDIGLGPIQVPITGTYTKDSFSFDYNNILYWMKIYHEGIFNRSGEYHSIRFCRSDDPNEMYIEYDYNKYPNGLVLCSSATEVGYIDNIKTFKTSSEQPVGYAPNAFLFLYATTVGDVDPDSGAQFYIGCFNMDNLENIGSIYKGSFSDINVMNTDAPHLDSVTTTSSPYFQVTGTKTNPTRTYNFNCYNTSYTENQFIIITRFNITNPSAIGHYCIIFSQEPLSAANFSMSTGGTAPYYSFYSVSSTQFPTLNIVRGGPWFYTRDQYDLSTVSILMNHYPLSYYYAGTFSSEEEAKAYMTDDVFRYFNTVVVNISASSRDDVYEYLAYVIIPPTEVSPTDIPPADEPTDPSQPDIQDPYYDPTSDPESPRYDPTKDPKSPSYDPTVPHTPYRPVSQPEHQEPPVQPPQDDIPLPTIPPSYITNNKMFTLYNPSGGDLNDIATFLWSSGWSVDAFKKIFANPIQCILGLMVLPQLSATVSTKELTFGNIPSGITLHYFDSQFFDFDCGSFDIKEYYASYLDYAPYTKVSIFLPFIGDHELDVDEVMNKTISVKYRFDLASGDCVAFIFVGSSVHYQFSGNCAARLPIGVSSSNALSSLFSLFSMAASVPAGLPALGAASAIAVTSMKQKISHSGSISGSPGIMGVQTPYLIITRPRQAYPMNQNIFTGYPAFITESLSQLTGYTEVEQVHLEHIPATGEELAELERLLKEGVLF